MRGYREDQRRWRIRILSTGVPIADKESRISQEILEQSQHL